MKTLLLTLSALALSQAVAATEVTVNLSEDFAEDLAETYGEREGDVLRAEIIEDLDYAFAKQGVEPARVEVTINRARPNRPTMEQARAKPGLDMHRSISLGGMDLTGTAYDAAGNIIATQQYDWFETDIRQAFPAGTWSDAKRASHRFAKRLATEVSAN